MNMKKWIISVVTLALALGIAGAGTAFALTGDDGSDSPTVLDDTDTQVDPIMRTAVRLK